MSCVKYGAKVWLPLIEREVGDYTFWMCLDPINESRLLIIIINSKRLRLDWQKSVRSGLAGHIWQQSDQEHRDTRRLCDGVSRPAGAASPSRVQKNKI